MSLLLRVINTLIPAIAPQVRAVGAQASESLSSAGPALAHGAVATISNILNHKITDIADPLLDECYHRLNDFLTTAVQTQVTSEKRAEIARLVEDFNLRRTTPLEQKENEILKEFLQNVKSSNPLNYPLIVKTFKIIEEKWKAQTGLITLIVERALEQLRRTLHLTPSMGQEVKLAPKALDDAYQLLANLQERVDTHQHVGPNVRQTVATALSQLTSLSTSCDERKDLAGIIEHLNSDQPINPDLIKTSYEFVHKKWLENSGLPAIVLDVLTRATQRALVSRSIIDAATTFAHPLLNRCYQQITDLQEQIAIGKKELTPAQRQVIATDLEELRKGLPAEQQQSLLILLQYLSTAQPLNQEVIAKAHKIIEDHWKQNSGLLASVVEAVSRQAKRALTHPTIVCSTTKLATPLVQWCYTEISYLYEHSAETPKAFSITDPRLFAENFEQLADALAEPEKQHIMALRQCLVQHQPLERRLIEEAYEIIHKLWLEQSGFVAGLTDAVTRQLRRAFGPYTSRHILEEPIEVISKASLEALASKRQVRELPPSSEKNWSQIENQLVTLQNHIYKKAVGTLLFTLSNIPPTRLSQILNKLASQKETETNEGQFKQVLFEFIEQEGIPPFRLFVVKASYTLLAPLIKYFITKYLENIHTHLKDWITKHESYRLETFDKVLIQGMNSCFSGILLTYNKIKNSLDTRSATDIDNLLTGELKTLKINDQTQDQILYELIHTFLAYSPELKWAENAKKECLARRAPALAKNPEKPRLKTVYPSELNGIERIAIEVNIPDENNKKPEKPLVQRAWWYFCEQLFSFANFITFPFQWVIHKVTAYFAGRAIKSVIPSLYEKTTSAIGMGGFYVHPLNEFLARKLGEINREFDRKNGEAIAEAATSVQIPSHLRTRLEETINAVLKTLLKQRQAKNFDAFQKDTTPLPDILLERVLEFAPPALTSQLIPLIKKLANQDFLENLVLTVLQNANQQFLEAPESIPRDPERPQKQETEVEVQLKELGKKTITKAIDEAFYPQKRIQKEINIFFLSLYKGIYGLLTRQENGSVIRNSNHSVIPIPDLNFDNFSRFKTKWEDFLEVRKRLEQHMNENTDEATRERIRKILTEFDAVSDQFHKNLSKLQEMIAHLRATDLILDLLSELQNPLTVYPPSSDLLSPILKKIDFLILPPDLQGEVQRFHAALQENLKRQFFKSQQFYINWLGQVIERFKPSKSQQVREIDDQIQTTSQSFHPIFLWLHRLEPFKTEAKPSLFISALKSTFPQATIVSTLANQMLSLPRAALEFGNDPQKVKIKVVALYIIQKYLSHNKGARPSA